MTRSALLALRASAGLSLHCDYQITDFVQGRFLAGTTITMRAVAANELSTDAEINSLFDNSGWECVYDIDSNDLLEVRDNLGNVVRSTVANRVSTFDWGNPAYRDNVFEGQFTLTYGATVSVTGNHLTNTGQLSLTGMTGGQVTQNTVDGIATLTNSNLSLRQSSIEHGSTLNATGYTGAGTGVYRARIDTGASLSLSGAGAVNVQRTHIGRAANVSHSGAGSFTINYGYVTDGASVSHSSTGAFNMTGCNIVGAATTVTHTVGVLSMTGTQVGPYGRVTKNNAASTGTLTINYCVIDTAGHVLQDGAGPMSLTGTTVANQSYARTLAGSNVSAFNLNYSRLDSSAYFDVQAGATAGTINVQGCSFSGNGFVTKSGTGNLVLNYCDFRNSGRAQLLGVRSLTLQYCAVTNMGRIVSNTTAGAGVADSVTYTTVDDYAVVQFNATGAAANQVNYSSLRGLTANVSFAGTNTGTNLTRATVDNGNITFTSNTVAFPTILDIGVRDQGTLAVSGCSAAQDIRYSSVQSYGRWTMTNRAVAAANYGLDIGAQGTLTQSNAAGNCYYGVVRQGTVNHNGGTLSVFVKEMGGALTTGAFAHSNIQHRANVSKTLTAANSNRADYQGLAAQLV